MISNISPWVYGSFIYLLLWSSCSRLLPIYFFITFINFFPFMVFTFGVLWPKRHKDSFLFPFWKLDRFSFYIQLYDLSQINFSVWWKIQVRFLICDYDDYLSSCSSSLLSRLPKEKLSLHTTLLTPGVWIFHTKQFPVLCGRQVLLLLLLSHFSHVRLCATP